MQRVLEPEWLDHLEPSDARAVRARRELRLVNALMGNASFIARALRGALRDGARIADLGTGDGRLILAVAKKLRPRPRAVALELVDRAPAVGDDTLGALRALGWQPVVRAADVHDWLRGAGRCDAITVNLFLHHFEMPALRELLSLAAQRTRLLVACEPRRSGFALLGSRALILLGCGPVTRHDAALSVKAGFRGRELCELWPIEPQWRLTEEARGPFSHLFVARRDA